MNLVNYSLDLFNYFIILTIISIYDNSVLTKVIAWQLGSLVRLTLTETL